VPARLRGSCSLAASDDSAATIKTSVSKRLSEEAKHRDRRAVISLNQALLRARPGFCPAPERVISMS
jgi:hypothetical protein